MCQHIVGLLPVIWDIVNVADYGDRVNHVISAYQCCTERHALANFECAQSFRGLAKRALGRHVAWHRETQERGTVRMRWLCGSGMPFFWPAAS